MPVPIPPPDVVHTYEFPSETMVAPFGAGWTLSGSHTRSTYFPVGSSLDDIISIYNGLQDEGTLPQYLLSKTVVLREVTYKRKSGADTITITYPTISKVGQSPTTVVNGTVTSAERVAILGAAAGAAVTGWVITSRVNHPVVTLTTKGGKGGAIVNPRFLSMFDALDYVRVPSTPV
jgi:hypothetical protein